MPKYIHMTPDNTKQNFIELPNNRSDECWDILNKIGLANKIHNRYVARNVFKLSLGYFRPNRWITSIVPGE